MSAKALSYVWDHSPYTGTKRVIHLAVADVANDENNNRLWVSQGSISRKANCDPKTVTRTFAQMVDDGYLKVIKNNAAARKPNLYEFLMPTGDISSSTTDISSQPLGTSRPSTGVEMSHELNRTQEENSTTTSRVQRTRTERVRAREYTEEFEGFWQTYHKHKGPKPAAFDAWEKAMERGVDPQEIRDMAAQHTMVWTREGRESKFVPHAATWLNGDRWEAPIEEDPNKSALKGNAQLGKSFLPFEYEDGRDLAEKLGAKIYGKPQD